MGPKLPPGHFILPVENFFQNPFKTFLNIYGLYDGVNLLSIDASKFRYGFLEIGNLLQPRLCILRLTLCRIITHVFTSIYFFIIVDQAEQQKEIKNK